MVALTIRKDGTAAVLRCLARSQSDCPACRGDFWGLPMRFPAWTGRGPPKRREWTAKRCGTGSSANTDGVEGLRDRWGTGRPARLKPDEQAELAAIILRGPDAEAEGIWAYTLEDLARLSQFPSRSARCRQSASC